MTRTKQASCTVILAMFLAVFCSGCPKGTYHDVVVVEHQFSTTLKAFQDAENKEFQSGRVDPNEHKAIGAGEEKVGKATQVLVQSLQSGALNTTVQQNYQTLEVALTSLLNDGVLGVKNDTSKQLLQLGLQTASDILNNAGLMLAAPKTATITKGN